MKINFNDAELNEILADFHTLTKMRIIILDENFKRIVAFPEKSCGFCSILKSNHSARALCKNCDEEACIICRESGKLNIYNCHAGLTEVAAPIKMNGIAVGYVMFGQIINKKEKAENRDKIIDYCRKFTDDSAKLGIMYDKLLCKNENQIKAASKIVECCISYLVMNRLVRVDKGNLGYLISEYVSANIKNEIHSEDICRAFGIGRTKLFEVSKRNFGMSIARYIRKKKVEAAAAYMAEHGCKVSEAADYAGFSDYNYFSKVFKAETGFSPKKYEKNLRA